METAYNSMAGLFKQQQQSEINMLTENNQQLFVDFLAAQVHADVLGTRRFQKDFQMCSSASLLTAKHCEYLVRSWIPREFDGVGVVVDCLSPITVTISPPPEEVVEDNLPPGNAWREARATMWERLQEKPVVHNAMATFREQMAVLNRDSVVDAFVTKLGMTDVTSWPAPHTFEIEVARICVSKEDYSTTGHPTPYQWNAIDLWRLLCDELRMLNADIMPDGVVLSGNWENDDTNENSYCFIVKMSAEQVFEDIVLALTQPLQEETKEETENGTPL